MAASTGSIPVVLAAMSVASFRRCRPHGRCRTQVVGIAHGAAPALRSRELLFEGRCVYAVRSPFIFGISPEVQGTCFDFVSSPTGNSSLRAVNQRKSSSLLCPPGLALGFGTATGHRPTIGWAAAPRAIDQDRSAMCLPCSLRSSCAAAFPIGDTPAANPSSGPPQPGGRQQASNHDICSYRPEVKLWVSASGFTVVWWLTRDGCGGAAPMMVHGFTIGQRRAWASPGLGPMMRPRYVTAIDADTATNSRR